MLKTTSELSPVYLLFQTPRKSLSRIFKMPNTHSSHLQDLLQPSHALQCYPLEHIHNTERSFYSQIQHKV